MRRLPLPDPGTPDTRSPGRFFLWLARGQARTLAAGAFFGVVWMVSQAFVPLLIGRALDAGIAQHDTAALVGWVAALALLGIVQAGAGIGRHRHAVTNWLTATYRCDQLIARASARLGAALTQRLSVGEVVNLVSSDSRQIGNALDITARLSGAVVSFIAVAALLLRTSVPLGLVVLFGVPLLMAGATPLLRPLHSRQGEQRAQVGQLTALGTDTVTGLRVLRGMGGERAFHARYRQQSQRVRSAGVATGRIVSLIDAQQVLLPGVFIVVLTWLGARLAVQHSLSVGGLVAFYGWAAFLVMPLRTFTEALDKMTRAHVAVLRLQRLLTARPGLTWGTATMWPPGPIVDAATGLSVPTQGLVAVACVDTADGTALADRLGRYVDAEVHVGDVPLREFSEETVRSQVLVVDAATTLFGERLRDELDPHRRHDDAALLAALEVADALDVLDALPDRLDTMIGERGRSLSGGERQRVVLARSLLADPPVLVLVDPTSAVDAHTEARIASRLGQARSGRTTVLVSTSPLLLRVADACALIDNGVVIAQGSRDEVHAHPAFRAALDRAALT